MENEPAVINAEYKMVNVEEYAMKPSEIVKQVKLIQEVMEQVMKKDEHYGTIPGCEKPSLYKPGAEKLSVTFRLVPKYEIRKTDLPNGHREYEIVCSLYHAPTGQFFGQGVGSCSTMESKYRYRNADPIITETPVPKKYWDLRKENKMNEAQDLIGGKGFTTKKTDSGWFVAKKSGDRMEHDNPADYYNTVLKMGKKRAQVDAVLTATAASDIFTQDIEDLPEPTGHGTEPTQKKKEEPPATKTKADHLSELRENIRKAGFTEEEMMSVSTTGKTKLDELTVQQITGMNKAWAHTAAGILRALAAKPKTEAPPTTNGKTVYVTCPEGGRKPGTQFAVQLCMDTCELFVACGEAQSKALEAGLWTPEEGQL